MDKEVQIEELQKQLETVQNRNKELEEENQTLKNAQSSTNIHQTHSEEFWLNIDTACRSDTDYVKSLVANKTITMYDTNTKNQTLLIIATCNGNYDLVQLCLNLESDIKHKGNDDLTALDQSRKGGYVHIEQLLLFSEMNASIGNRIKETSITMNKQKGIIQNIMKQLSVYDNTTKQFFQDTMMDMMLTIISKKLAFSDDLLNFCWCITINDDRNNGLESDLWKCLKKTCQDIINNESKRDWFWFKTFVLPSTIWYQQIDPTQSEVDDQKRDDKPSYLYYELLKLVESQANNQLIQLEKDLSVISNKSDWDKLVQWDIPKHDDIVRQDLIPNGIMSRYSFNELSEHMGVSATFNTHTFYDYNDYLPQLVLLSNIVDDEFQKSVQMIFNIDKHTKIGKITTNEQKNDTEIIYTQGPVKVLERARTKAANDYQQEKYPTTACVLDFNRCSLIFHDISTLLSALESFTNKVKYYQSGNIIGICRAKNGFKEYIKQTQYADIKLNILIKGKINNIIGEVQFLLIKMKQFKDKAHNLYSVQRQKEYVDNTVSLILPNLMDEEKQLFVAGNMGDVRALCGLMAINNKTEKDIMKIDESCGESILMPVVGLGHDRAYRFLKRIIDIDLFVRLLFVSNQFNFNVIEGAIAFGRNELIKDMFSIKAVKTKYKSHKDYEWRLMWWLFAHGTVEVIDFVESELNVSHENVKGYMEYKHHSECIGFYQYTHMSIITGISQRNGSIDAFKKLVSIIGRKCFVRNVFVSDGYNKNAIEYLISKNRLEMMEYMMSFDEIKKECLKNERVLFRIVWWMNEQCDEEMYNFMVNILKTMDVSSLETLKSYQYAETKDVEFDKTAIKYWDEKITDSMMKKLLNAVND